MLDPSILRACLRKGLTLESDRRLCDVLRIGVCGESLCAIEHTSRACCLLSSTVVRMTIWIYSIDSSHFESPSVQ